MIFEKTRNVCIKMPITMIEEIDALARELGQTRSDLVREAVEIFLELYKKTRDEPLPALASREFEEVPVD